MTTTQANGKLAGPGTSGMLPVRDTQLYVADTGSGPPLLFIHGMCGDAEVWRGQVERLSLRFRCITYDRRGHTRSLPGVAGESVPTHAEDAAALIRALGIHPIVVASSGGARITVELARRHPQLLAGMVVSEPPIVSLVPDVGAAFMREIIGVVQPAVAAGGPRAAVDAFFTLVCPGLWAALDEIGKDRYRANAAMMLAEFAGPRYELRPDDLPLIGVPALVLAGTVTHPALRRIAEVLADGLPAARFAEITGAGHVTYAERPDAFAHEVEQFARALLGDAHRQR